MGSFEDATQFPDNFEELFILILAPSQHLDLKIDNQVNKVIQKLFILIEIKNLFGKLKCAGLLEMLIQEINDPR